MYGAAAYLCSQMGKARDRGGRVTAPLHAWESSITNRSQLDEQHRDSILNQFAPMPLYLTLYLTYIYMLYICSY